MMGPQQPRCKKYVYTVVFTMLAWIISIIFGGVYMSIEAPDIKNRSDEYSFEIAPADWSFQIWYFIYLYQLIFFIYAIFTLFPKFNLIRVPFLCFPFYIAQLVFSTIGGVLATKYMHWGGFCSILGMTLSIYICSYISIKSEKKGRCKYIMLYTYAVDNALAVLSGWLTIATLLSLGIAMIHGPPHVPQRCMGTVALGILMAQLVVFCGLELTVLADRLRYVWTHYIALIVACIGIVAKNWDPLNRNSIMVVAISGFVACAFVVKMLRMSTDRCEREDRVGVVIESGINPLNEKEQLEKELQLNGR